MCPAEFDPAFDSKTSWKDNPSNRACTSWKVLKLFNDDFRSFHHELRAALEVIEVYANCFVTWQRHPSGERMLGEWRCTNLYRLRRLHGLDRSIPVVMINDTVARQYWLDENPAGRGRGTPCADD
jgi:hypothetical protein